MSLEELLNVDGVEQQSRMGRLLLAQVDSDPLLAAQVWIEAANDRRGEGVALTALVVALTEAMTKLWLETTDRETLAGNIRRSLADWAGKEGNHG